MKSSCPHDAYHFMMCQRIGRFPTVIIGLGIRCVSSPIRTPRPPQKTTTFTKLPSRPRSPATTPPDPHLPTRSHESQPLAPLGQFRTNTVLLSRGSNGCERYGDDQATAPLRDISELRLDL